MLEKLIEYIKTYFYGKQIKNTDLINQENDISAKKEGEDLLTLLSLINSLLNDRDYYMLNHIIEEGINFDDINQDIFKKHIISLHHQNKSDYFDDFRKPYIYDFLIHFIVKNANIVNYNIKAFCIFYSFDYFDYFYYLFEDKCNPSIFFNKDNFKNYIEESHASEEKNKFFNDNKESLIFINDFICEDIEKFSYDYIKLSIEKNSFSSACVNFLIYSFNQYSNEFKSFVVDYLFKVNNNKKQYLFIDNDTITDFLKENQHYRKKINVEHLIKNKLNTQTQKIEAINQNTNNITILLKKNNFPNEIVEISQNILLNYETLKSNKDKINVENILLIEKLVEEKTGVILNNLISIGELNKLLSKSNKLIDTNSEEYQVSLKSLNGIRDILIKEITVLKEIEKEKILVLDKYIYAER